MPILEKLRDGEKFDFETLIDNHEEVEQFWNIWWEGRDFNQIDRPETILDDDPILSITKNKDTADLLTNSDFFNEELTQAICRKRLVQNQAIRRADLQNQLIKIVGSNSVKLEGRPKIVFAGGGYGSGKTTILSRLASDGKLPVQMGHMVGVDYFKLYIPEFSLIQAVSDGRASLTVQQECKMLAAGLFKVLIEAERSFILDSSMSAEAETMDTIQRAVQKGYEMSLIAVLTPVEIAIRQAMGRAFETRRFPHKEYLPTSHIGFRKSFMKYVPVFEDVTLLAKIGESNDLPVVVAEKKDGKNLAIYDEVLFNDLLKVPNG